MKTLIRVIVLTSATGLLGACAEQQEPAMRLQQVLLSEATAAGDAQAAAYPGRTRASETTNVAFRVSGTLASVSVKEGDYVRRGQVVARIDDRDYRTQLAATEAEYAQVKAEAERVISLYGDSATSANNYDKARYGLQQIGQKLQNHRDQVADCVLRAPFDGYVQNVLHEGHETVGAGMPVVTMFAAGGVEVVINIPASDYQRRDEFDGFTAKFDVLPGREFRLRLLGISRRANANQLYEVRLAVDGVDGQITPGMATMVGLHYRNTESQAVVVPSSAVFTDADGPAVFVYRPDGASDGAGTLVRVPVEVNFVHSDGRMEVAAGITVGDNVVTSGVHQLKAGQRVRPYPMPSSTNVGGLL